MCCADNKIPLRCSYERLGNVRVHRRQTGPLAPCPRRGRGIGLNLDRAPLRNFLDELPYVESRTHRFPRHDVQWRLLGRIHLSDRVHLYPGIQ